MNHDEASRSGRAGERAAAAYPLELPITFQGGTGLTRAISREEVLFATAVALVGGQLLAGMLHFPAEGEAAGLVLRYVMRVAHVRSPTRSDGTFEVSARFERFDFVPCAGPAPVEWRGGI